MKKSVKAFLKANGFALSFGFGIVALVAALAVYNVNNRNNGESQNINLNEPIQMNVADADDTNETKHGISDDMDVPMDMQKGIESDNSQAKDSVETVMVPGQKKESNSERKDGSEIINSSMNAEEMTEGEVKSEGMRVDDVSGDIVNDAVDITDIDYTPIENMEFLGMEEVSMPVLGNIILPYSMDTTVYYKTLGTYRCNPGVLIQAVAGTEVTSIWHGQVVAVEDSKEYGHMVRVNLGSGYEMLYGQLGDVCVKVGDEVYKDSVIGTVAEPTAYFEQEGPHVYFAMTKDGAPIDPLDILQLE